MTGAVDSQTLYGLGLSFILIRLIGCILNARSLQFCIKSYEYAGDTICIGYGTVQLIHIGMVFLCLELKSGGLRVMNYSIWLYNQNYDAIQTSMQTQDPDILLLTEVSSDAMSILQDRLTYPHSSRTTGGNNVLFSRHPILSARSNLLGVSVKGRTYNLVARLQIEQTKSL